MDTDDRLYIVAYDIGNQKRWRRVWKIMNGYGDWLQLSVFQCRLSRRRRAQLETALLELIHHTEDKVVVIDVGPADAVRPKVVALGQAGFEPVERKVVII